MFTQTTFLNKSTQFVNIASLDGGVIDMLRNCLKTFTANLDSNHEYLGIFDKNLESHCTVFETLQLILASRLDTNETGMGKVFTKIYESTDFEQLLEVYRNYSLNVD